MGGDKFEGKKKNLKKWKTKKKIEAAMDHPAETASVVAGNSSFQVSPFFDQVNKYKKKRKAKKKKAKKKKTLANQTAATRSDFGGFTFKQFLIKVVFIGGHPIFRP